MNIKGELENWENIVQIPLARYNELLRKEWVYDMTREDMVHNKYASSMEKKLYNIKEEEGANE